MTITRDELYDLVWSTPMRSVARTLGVSDVYLARVCASLDVPHPKRGYWAKRAAGQAPASPPLPPPGPATPQKWSKGSAVVRRPKRRTMLPPPDPRRRKGSRDEHNLIAEAKHLLQVAQPDELGYLKPKKKLLADIISSKGCLDKCLAFADDLYNALETAGYPVMVAPAFLGLARMSDERPQRGNLDSARPWSPMRPTVAYLGGAQIGLTLAEIMETRTMRYVGDGRFIEKSDYKEDEHVGHTWIVDRVAPAGRLCLTAYSPYYRLRWSKRWIEEPKEPLGKSLAAIVATLESAGIDLCLKLAAAERPLH